MSRLHYILNNILCSSFVLGYKRLIDILNYFI
nr:MAG TPA: hypothetical protein [Crassvirales sp.]